MSTPYTPINCSFYDELEALATTRQLCTLVYRTQPDSPPVTYRGIVTDLYIDNKVEYLRLKDGFTLRLDNLLAVNNKERRDVC